MDEKTIDKKETIEKRYDTIDIFIQHSQIRNQIQTFLKTITDIERLLSRLSVHIGNARDVVNVKNTLQTMLSIKETIQKHLSASRLTLYAKNDSQRNKTLLLEKLCNDISDNIKSIISLIETYIVDEPPIDIRGGGIIRDTVNSKLDLLRKRISGSKIWIAELERQERERTGIGSLKVRFNKVFGFYIEISKSHMQHAPANYIRKQTLVNGERFITPELKKHEEIILTAEEEINALEYTLFCDVLKQILEHIEVLQKAAEAVATIDCLINFADIAQKNNYVRPTLLYSGELQVTNGRHPVVEQLLDTENQFVPNDVTLDNTSQQLLLITGPNMAGKSVFIRQVALIVLMAHMGCFVPAKKAYISVVDRIFVRSGASDVITSGLSTFMVEMVETAHILHHATKNSLIIMDEIGRGTSTYDGISIAWAVAEYLVKSFKIPPKTLFATHYHELQELEKEYPKQIKNYSMSVTNHDGKPIFLHTIVPGGASHSFGVAVAKLAGVPETVITRANEMLHTLEKRNIEEKEIEEINYPPQPINIADHLIHKELEQMDIHQMTPLEALNKLAELKNKLKLFQIQREELIEVD